MLCEKCHANEATEVLLVDDGEGGRIETFVCKACAARIRRGDCDDDAETPDAGESEETATQIIGDAEDAPPFVKNLLDATIDFIQGVSDAGKKAARKCPACGRTFPEIADAKTLGCPECWKTFGDELKTHFLRAQYGGSHIGEPPPSAERAVSRTSLVRQFKAAMARQDFRKAAEIKRRLDALDGADE